MKQLSKVCGVAVLVLSFSAGAQFRTINKAYEVPIENLRIPGTPSASLALRQCSDCDLITIRVTPDTQYVIYGQRFELAEFRRDFVRVRRSGYEKPVIVKHNLETDTVVSVTLK